MYFNRISSGTILALLAMSGILLLVPLAAPAHAANQNLPTITRDYTWVCGGGNECDFNFNLTNPASNQFALTAFTMAVPAGWSISFCDWYNSAYFDNCTNGPNSAEWQPGSSGLGLPPGATQDLEIGINYPTQTTYPVTVTLTTTVQDQSSANFYTGPTTQVLDANPAGMHGNPTFGYVAVSGVPATYTAGSGTISVTAQLKDSGAANVANGGIIVFFTQATAAHYGTFSGSGITCLRAQQCWGFTDSTGKVTATFQPQNIAGGYSFEAVAGGGYFGDGSYCNPPDCNYYYSDSGSVAYTVAAGAPTSVGYQLSASPFPSIDWLPFGTGSAAGTTTNTGTSGTFTGAVLCVATQQSCTGASPANTAIDISATDKFGNPDSFGAGGITFVGSQNIQIQTASGGLFDATSLPSTITCGVTAGFVCPPGGTSFTEPFNYYQGAPYGTAGVMTTTITGTYNSATFSVSGSSGAIETSTFATTGAIDKTDHVTALPAQQITAGKSVTFDVVLGIAQQNVPITLAVCAHTVCATSTKGYSGTFTTLSGTTNSSGIFSSSLNVDTKAGHVADINASVLAPINGAPTNHFWIGPSNDQTTKSGSAAKFTVVVGTGPVNGPAPITYAYPGETVYVNVVTSDTYGNPVSTVGIQQVQIALTANPATLSASNVYIPTACYETNGTFSNGCDATHSSFGAIAWTLPNTAGSTATISASGVLNGVSTTSATVTLSIVSKTPTLSVFSPKPLNNVIYSNSANVQFRGWANASLGYNGAASMSTLSWKVGSGSWASTGLAGVTSQWSVIATLPSGLSTIVFNATDSKGNTVVSSTFTVLVDSAAPTITNVTPAGATLNPGQLFQATIVDPEGDLNATSVGLTYNGTALASSAITISGTNNPGSSVTYTVTAALPTSVGNPGHWNVAVSASDLSGNTATGPSELITVTVAFGNSITFLPGATYGTVGAYKGVTVQVMNSWSTSQTIVVFATIKSGTNIYVAQGTVTVGAGQTATVFCADLQVVPAGTYSVTFSAVTTSNAAVSAPTTPITLTAT